MQKNIGTNDRLIRFAIGIVLFILAFWQRSLILGLLGSFVLFEALSSWCILYQLFGKNSCGIKKR